MPLLGKGPSAGPSIWGLPALRYRVCSLLARRQTVTICNTGCLQQSPAWIPVMRSVLQRCCVASWHRSTPSLPAEGQENETGSGEGKHAEDGRALLTSSCSGTILSLNAAVLHEGKRRRPFLPWRVCVSLVTAGGCVLHSLSPPNAQSARQRLLLWKLFRGCSSQNRNKTFPNSLGLR